MLRATAESKAVAEREQVLLHRIALRERLVNVDWSRGTEVVHELRAESARALQATLDPAAALAAGAGHVALSAARSPPPRPSSLQTSPVSGRPTR